MILFLNLGSINIVFLDIPTQFSRLPITVAVKIAV